MKLRTRLLLAFVGIAIMALLVFGSLAYRIALDAGLQREMGILGNHAEASADALGQRLRGDNSEQRLLESLPSSRNPAYLFMVLRQGDLISATQPLQIYFGVDYGDFPLRDLRGDEAQGKIRMGQETIIWTRSAVPGSDYRLVLLYKTRGTVLAPLESLGVRLLLSGLFIIWAAVWLALIVSAYITRHLDKKHAEIVHQAMHDELTDLPNRNLLFDRLAQCITLSERNHKKAALMVMDLDRFKEVNDTLGHSSGDILLQQVAVRMRKVLRDSDTIARLGGDEFAVVLPDADERGSSEVAEKIVAVMAQPFQLDDMSLEMDISIGIAVYPEHGEDSDSLIRHADVAMYHAKRSGYGFAIYGPDTDPHSLRRLVLAGDLRHAIENNELQLYFQPKLDVRTGSLIGAEALLRWKHREHGMVPPDEFVGIAEQSGLIKQLTHWVLQEGIRHHANWRKQGVVINVAVNLSARNLQDRQLPEYIAELLAKYNVQASALTLEITESAVMADPKHALEVLTELHDMGLSLSIDDFGTGHSSLAYLKRLPVNEIKIDRSFVMDMARDEEDRVIVSTIIALAHNVGLKVVAEGVENRDALEYLARFRCDTAQGYHISRPMPEADMLAWYGNFDAVLYAVDVPVMQIYSCKPEPLARGA